MTTETESFQRTQRALARLADALGIDAGQVEHTVSAGLDLNERPTVTMPVATLEKLLDVVVPR